jgi:hypothetical protein
VLPMCYPSRVTQQCKWHASRSLRYDAVYFGRWLWMFRSNPLLPPAGQITMLQTTQLFITLWQHRNFHILTMENCMVCVTSMS